VLVEKVVLGVCPAMGVAVPGSEKAARYRRSLIVIEEMLLLSVRVMEKIIPFAPGAISNLTVPVAGSCWGGRDTRRSPAALDLVALLVQLEHHVRGGQVRDVQHLRVLLIYGHRRGRQGM